MLGSKQALVLEIICTGDGDAYGAGIARELYCMGFPTSLPQIYSILGKLEDAGFVRHRMGEATPERGGRSKRLYTITGDGVRELADFKSNDGIVGDLSGALVV